MCEGFGISFFFGVVCEGARLGMLRWVGFWEQDAFFFGRVGRGARWVVRLPLYARVFGRFLGGFLGMSMMHEGVKLGRDTGEIHTSTIRQYDLWGFFRPCTQCWGVRNGNLFFVAPGSGYVFGHVRGGEINGVGRNSRI